MFLVTLFILLALLGCFHHCTYKKTDDKLTSSDSLQKLQYKYFVVYFPAVFADWLQGPYLYKLYSSYGFRDDEIFLLYMVGFASSLSFGTCVSCLADFVGRKRMCIVFDMLFAISCCTKLSTSFQILVFGRILSGVCSSILFSVFEAWYVYQHIEKQHLPTSWISNTFAKVTFYNGFLAILAGLISHIFVDIFEMGPQFPFLLAIPCLIFSATFKILFWNETYIVQRSNFSENFALKIIFCNSAVLSLCVVQSIFESVMYIFVILWTPVLSPIVPPLGIVFSCFMLSIMIGSSIYNWLVAKKYGSNSVLTISLLLGSCALGMCVLSLSFYNSSVLYPYPCFFSFLFYEVAVGLYFPAISFTRSLIIPELNRAGLISWFRVPINVVTCFCLFYFRHQNENIKNIVNESSQKTPNISSNQQIFALCAFALFCTSCLSSNLKLKVDNVNSSVKNINEY